MKKGVLLGALASMLLSMTACTAPSVGSGVIAMVPFSSDDFGIHGVGPAGWAEAEAGRFACGSPPTEDAQLLQESFPGSMDELVPLLLADTNLDALPERGGTYKDSAFSWDLYTFYTQIEELGAETYRLRLALAEGESVSYFRFGRDAGRVRRECPVA